MGKYSNSHIAREMQIKILLQYHFSHSRLGKSSKAWQYTLFVSMLMLMQDGITPIKNVAISKRTYIFILFPAIVLLGIYPEEIPPTISKYMSKVIEELFVLQNIINLDV